MAALPVALAAMRVTDKANWLVLPAASVICTAKLLTPSCKATLPNWNAPAVLATVAWWVLSKVTLSPAWVEPTKVACADWVSGLPCVPSWSVAAKSKLGSVGALVSSVKDTFATALAPVW